MPYMALYRKWRPDTFEEVKGQDHIVTTLKNQIINDRIGHAFLFCGTRGTGKTSVAKLFAKAVNCEHPVDGSPCNECETCKAIANGSSMNVIEIDAASNNGVDNIRQIRDEVQYPPTEGKYKVYIIDEVHMLSTGAFNALLKTLEEPPSYVIFILATTESHKIPITISSRCQKYDFRRISVETISDRLSNLLLRENVAADKRALNYIAKAADGSMRDALSILDQCIAFNLGKELTYDMVLETIGAVDIDIFERLLTKVIELDVSGAIDVIDEVIWQGSELSRFVSEFTWFLRNILLMKVSEEADKMLDMSAENQNKVKVLADKLELETIMRYINVFSETASNIKYATQKRVVLELAVIKLCKPEMETDYGSILDRIRVLEKKLEEGGNGSGVSKEQLQEMLSGMVPAGIYNQDGAASVVNEAEDGNRLKDKLKDTLPDAAYHELIDFINLWDEIASDYPYITRKYLDKGKVLLDDDKKGLLLTFIDEADSKRAIEYFKDKEHMEYLRSVIESTTGRRVKIDLRVVSADNNIRKEIEENDLLKINFNIDYK